MAERPKAIELIVDEDGVGQAESYCAGIDGGLLEQLRQVLGATMTITTRETGHGFHVSTVVPENIASVDHDQSK